MQLRKYGPPASAGACKEGARGSAPHARRRRALQLSNAGAGRRGRRRSIFASRVGA
jgi:hypothetical protein